MYSFVVFLVLLCSVLSEEEKKVDGPSATLEEIRKKWGAKDLVRDIEHIKEDVKKMTKLQELGEIKTDEIIFYFFRMHDFDDNGKLDGLELSIAMKHTLEHQENSATIADSDLIATVDSFMDHDENKDGFLTYAEMRKFTSVDSE